MAALLVAVLELTANSAGMGPVVRQLIESDIESACVGRHEASRREHTARERDMFVGYIGPRSPLTTVPLTTRLTKGSHWRPSEGKHASDLQVEGEVVKLVVLKEYALPAQREA